MNNSEDKVYCINVIKIPDDCLITVRDDLVKIDLEKLWKYSEIGLINAHVLIKFEDRSIPLFFEIYEISMMSCPKLVYSGDVFKVDRKGNTLIFHVKKE